MIDAQLLFSGTTQMTNILTAFAQARAAPYQLHINVSEGLGKEGECALPPRGFVQVQFRHAESIGKICGVVLRNSHSLTPEDSPLGQKQAKTALLMMLFL